MKNPVSSFLCTLLVIAGAALAGCQGMSAGSMDADKSTYVLVTPGNGAPYTVKVPAGHADMTEVIAKPGTATCAECIADAKAYALTGKMDATCKMCGAHREALTAMPPTSGHN